MGSGRGGRRSEGGKAREVIAAWKGEGGYSRVHAVTIRVAEVRTLFNRRVHVAATPVATLHGPRRCAGGENLLDTSINQKNNTKLLT